MLVFITSIRHPKTSNSYERVWDLLNNTLNSICNQKNKDFKVIVVCNKKLPLNKNSEKIMRFTEFIEVDFPPIKEIEYMQELRIDRGIKYVIGLSAGKKYNPNYIMFFDADDLIGNDISEYVNNNPNKNGWVIDKGYKMLGNKIAKKTDHNSICGTGNIFNFKLLITNIPSILNIKSSKEEIINSVDNHFLRFILGSHRFARKYFEKQSKPLKSFPFRSVIRLMGTGENYTDMINESELTKKEIINNPNLWNEIYEDQRKYFNIPKIINRKIFGIGFHKTGTKTLGECMKILGYNHLSYSKNSKRLLEDIVLRKNIQKIIKKACKFDSFDDWPWPLVYKELNKEFPQSKFILTIRKDSLTWFKSLKKHTEKDYFRVGCRKLVYGKKYPHLNKRLFLKTYNNHNKNVIEYFKDKPQKLLVVCWEKGDRWEKLCNFLGERIINTPLPHNNKGVYEYSKTKRYLRIIKFWTNRFITPFKPTHH